MQTNVFDKATLHKAVDNSMLVEDVKFSLRR